MAGGSLHLHASTLLPRSTFLPSPEGARLRTSGAEGLGSKGSTSHGARNLDAHEWTGRRNVVGRRNWQSGATKKKGSGQGFGDPPRSKAKVTARETAKPAEPKAPLTPSTPSTTTTASSQVSEEISNGSSLETPVAQTEEVTAVVEEVVEVDERPTEVGMRGVDELKEAMVEGSEKIAAEKLLAAEKLARMEADRLLAEKEQQARELAILRKREAQLKALVEEREMRLQQLEADRRAARLEKLQTQHEYSNSKFFAFPAIPEAGKEVEIYFQRSLSTLKDKGNVTIMGGYNDWRWKPFKDELKPSKIGNDWWVCTLQVPQEAFNVKFVFQSADNVFENNDTKDFSLQVEGGLDEAMFDVMWAEEKRREAERLAEIEAERERMAAEEQRQAEIRAQRDADRLQAMQEVQSLRNSAAVTYSKALHTLEGVWFTDPTEMEPGSKAILYYNRSWRPLWNSEQVWLHAGHNNWQTGVDNVQQLTFDNLEGGDWWSTEVTVPKDAFMLNWVLADGPPDVARQYDNNGTQDFAAIVGGAEEEASYFAALELQISKQLEEARVKKQEAVAAREKRRLKAKQQMRKETNDAFLRAQQRILYTEPAEPQAGNLVTVFYNPENTVLNGHSEVWIRGSFNRWTHRNGCFMPQKMGQSPSTTHLQATVTVPHDAYCMDFVFSDTGEAEGGTYDNKSGLDYHLPVVGSTVPAPPLHVVHIALEMAPIAKVGGLGDVVTSLSRAVQEAGHQVEVVLPKYDCLNYGKVSNLEERAPFEWGGTRIRCWLGIVEGVPVHFLEPENGMFWVGCIYGRKDDADRFGFFCHAALEFLLQSGRQPDIIHCHDWSSAPAVRLFLEQYRQYGLANARTVFTIHNLEFGQALIGQAMAACDKATTVSPTYALEVAGHPAINSHLGKFYGILNGIDPDIWDPLGDPFIPMPYEADEVVEGKKAAKEELQSRLGLAREDRPILGIVTRLTAQKGIDLIKAAIWRTLERGGQVVLLGSAPDSRIQADFQNLAAQLSRTHGDRARLWLSYDEPLSHLIYAGSDMILVPSIFEPCGLTQMIAMRYGAIPVVRRTGGLNDTVFDVDHDKERAQAAGMEVNGFNFEGADAAGLDYALNRAISAWYDGREWWNSLAGRVMRQDWSWNRPALDYIELYHGARK